MLDSFAPGFRLIDGSQLNEMVDVVNNLTGDGTPEPISATTLSVGNGTVALPSVTFTSDPDSGIYRIGANNLGLTVNAAKVLDIGTTGLAVTGLLSATTTLDVTGVATFANGTAALPGVAFTSDPDTGVYRIGANNLGVTAAGAKVLDVSATGLGVTGTTLSGDGAVGTPGFAFVSDPDSGLYRVGANDLGIATNGVIRIGISNSGVSVPSGSTSVTDFVQDGITTFTAETVAAAGATQGTATQITKSSVMVTVTASTQGVKLPVAAAGKRVAIFAAPTVGVKVYPATGDLIGAGATNAAEDLAANTGAIYQALDGVSWRVIRGA